MHFKLIVVVCVSGWLLQGVSSFRILAPPFVCPKDEDAVIDQPDNTIITLQTDAGIDMNFTWIVRWYPLEAPSQHFTLTLWRVVRKLERDLNGPQTEPGVYVISNTELLSGVNYIFNVTALSAETDEIVEKSFHIDNIKGDQQLLIEGQSNMFSIVLVGGQLTYADLDYVLEAHVTTCYKTHDYYFQWTVSSSANSVDVSDVKGSRLEIKAHSLTPGLIYNVLCKVFKYSNGEFITENGLQFNVLHRDLNVNFNVDVLVISVGTTFGILTNIKTNDYSLNQLEITWECTINDEKFEDFQIYDDSMVIFPSGLPSIGEYFISVTITVLGVSLTTRSSARIIVVEPQLPAIEVSKMPRKYQRKAGLVPRHISCTEESLGLAFQEMNKKRNQLNIANVRDSTGYGVYQTPRLINQDSVISLSANITNVVPGCSLTWYFIYDECLSTMNDTNADICTTDENGIPISETINFYSLEENFLNELTDYSNETTWKVMTTQLQAATGTARIVATCECNMIEHCSSKGTVYADVTLTVNEKPGPGEILVMPETGTAMETMFRISTLASVEPNRPVLYTFFCGLGNNDSLILGTYVEYLAIETLLPYIDGGTSIWVEVCDSLGACSIGSATSLDLAPGDARTLDALIEDVQALVMRCEIGLLRRLASSSIISYANAAQTGAKEKFTTTLLSTLQGIDQNCTEGNYDQYTSFLSWLSSAGLNTSDLI